MDIRRALRYLFLVFILACFTSGVVYAEDNEVTVYLTITDDSGFVTGNDAQGTTLARVPVKVGYRDLDDLGLGEFKRREAYDYEDGGDYIEGGDVIEQPTLLMLLLRAVELYYLGRDLEKSDIGTDAINISGSATHLFMEQFFGHDLNLLYYHNHRFPKQNPTTGATADYVLLEDGDEVDIAMFTDWGFHEHGCMAYFAETDLGVIPKGGSVSAQMMYSTTRELGEGEEEVQVPLPGEEIKVSQDNGKTWKKTSFVTDENGNVELTFEDPGVYLVSSGPHFAYMDSVGAEEPCVGPPVCVVRVRPDKTEGVTAVQSESGIDVSWSRSDGADGYSVEYRKSGSSWTEVSASGTSRSFSDLSWDTEYSFRVRAFKTDRYVPYGEQESRVYGQYSKEVTARTPAKPDDQELERIAEEVRERASAKVLEARSGRETVASLEEGYESALSLYEGSVSETSSAKEAYEQASVNPDQAAVRAAMAYRDAAEEQRNRAVSLVTAAEALKDEAEASYAAALDAVSMSEDAVSKGALVSEVLKKKAEAVLAEAEAEAGYFSDVLDRARSRYEEALGSKEASDGVLADAEEEVTAAERRKAEADESKTKEEIAEEDLGDAVSLREQLNSQVSDLTGMKSNIDADLEVYRNRSASAEKLYKDALDSSKKPGSAAVKAAEAAEKEAEALNGDLGSFRKDAEKLRSALTSSERALSDLDAAVEKAEESSREAYGEVRAEVTEVKEAAAILSENISELRSALSSAEEGMKDAEEKTESVLSSASSLLAKARSDLATFNKAKKAAQSYRIKGLKVRSKKRKVTVTWKKTKGASGYQVQYRLKTAKKWSVLKTTRSLKAVSKKLKRGRKYSFRVRTYTVLYGTRYYGKWSGIKNVKCK